MNDRLKPAIFTALTEYPTYNAVMTDLSPDSPITPDEVVAEQAITWFARLRAEHVPEEARRQFADWCQASPAHRQAFDEIGAFWEDADFTQLLTSYEQTASAYQRCRPHFKYVQVSALALAACLALLAVIYRPYLNCRQADYCTGIGEIQTVALADGSRVTLNSDTAMRVSLLNGRRDVRLERGEAFFDVHRDPQHPFVVEGRYSSTRVLGTRFVVRENTENDNVTVISGLVEVSGDRRTPVLLTANDSITVDAERSSEIQQVTAINATSWLKGSVSFDNAPLGEVIAEIGRYRRGSVIIKNAALKNLKVSGRFDITDTDKALEALQQTLPIRVFRVTPWLIFIA
ncbi:MAG: FecR family protein [Methylomonas sp.]|jgi:transmembrane sensor|uniref:FecR family protein n=1 Tax=Methylomonas sp. TaxID=418 RepID=UPI0025D19C3C|nr:FecR family protein [Methylomonas sp.]MCK9608487.1 FecR family protein [Methylomonas sp.]